MSQRETASRPAVHQSPLWIRAWFLISTLLVIWDFGYIFLRPRSMRGGDLFWLWQPYELYGTVDMVYSRAFFDQGQGFTSAQGLLNVVESALNFAYLGLEAHKSPVAVLVGFTTVVLTFWVRLSIFGVEDKNAADSFAIAYVFGTEIARGLRYGAKAKVL
ncbi:hypothetical protein OIO90_005011 [Microbotryomycetes sp. JL221]|nr:hypothetical protein OIO90_005011 [Microbotryomycetes sp. JL221]